MLRTQGKASIQTGGCRRWSARARGLRVDRLCPRAPEGSRDAATATGSAGIGMPGEGGTHGRRRVGEADGGQRQGMRQRARYLSSEYAPCAESSMEIEGSSFKLLLTK